MNFDENIPIYLQISNLIKLEIIQEKYVAGGKMPSVRDLAGSLKVNPNTIQRAYTELDNQGLLYTKRGMGTFVVEDPDLIARLKVEMARRSIENFLDQMLELGLSTDEIIKIIGEIRRD